MIDVKSNINHNECDGTLCCYNNMRLSTPLCKYKCDYMRHVNEYLTLAIINSLRLCIKMNHRFVDGRHVCISLKQSIQPLTTCYDLIVAILLPIPPIDSQYQKCSLCLYVNKLKMTVFADDNNSVILKQLCGRAVVFRCFRHDLNSSPTLPPKGVIIFKRKL